MSIYTATKAFNDALSEGKRKDLETNKNNKIDILCLLPGFVTTNMTRNSRNFFTVSA